MTDIKDKLELLRKQRQSRSKSQRIKDTWDEIDKGSTTSTAEKLRRLISLTQQEKPAEPDRPVFESQPREPIQFFENPYNLETKYGKVKLSMGLEIPGNLLSCLSREGEFENLDLSTALFLDLETTGLSGGTGVVPFLVGMGYYRDDKFYVSMYFLGDLAEEEQMIAEIGRFFSEMDFKSVVTYNGKGFDMPLLETRFILHRQPFTLSSLPHLDFLFPARSLWSHKYENCRLYNLARELVGAFRDEDIPSAEIPWRYYQYLQTGNFDLIEPVIYHNQEDILSLLAVVIMGSLILAKREEECEGDALDLFGAGKIMERLGDREQSVGFFERALEGKLPDEISLLAMKKLSYILKKNQDWEKAVALWKQVTTVEKLTQDHLFSFRELAMYFEHQEKNYEEAKKIAEEGYVLSMNISSYYEQDFSHRMERLRQKLKRQKK